MHSSKIVRIILTVITIIGVTLTLYYWGFVILSVIAGILLVALALLFKSDE